ncbi:MAG: hypothetical protein H6686_07010 [Fibrobacteria bacterium]|nr:hypothetical protein [Fibrobacteria bacterium]
MSSRRKPSSRRGIAMFLMLGIVIFFTMLGFMGMQFSTRDSGITGAVLDLRSRDVATRSGMSLALQVMSANPANTATQLGKFIADSSSANPRQWLDFTTNPFSVSYVEPGWYAISSGTDESAIKVRIVSMDIGTATGGPSDGVRLTMECMAKGRNADAITVLSSFRVQGIQVPLVPAASVTNNFALYLDGSLANSNMGATVNGDVYINGSTSLNGPAFFTVHGKLRVSGDFNTNAPLTVDSNAVIGGKIYTNGSAPMTFSKNVVVKGGIDVMNSNLTVAGNLDVQGVSSAGSWNSSATLRVGGDFWYRSECRYMNGPLRVGGKAFFDACFKKNTSSTDSVGALYVGRNGGAVSDTIQAATIRILGDFGNWHTSAFGEGIFMEGAQITVGGNSYFEGPFFERNNGRLTVAGSAQFRSGIKGLNNTPAVKVTGTTFLNAADQHGNFNGWVELGNDFSMKGSVNGDFGSTGAKAWRFSFGATSKVWTYESFGCLGFPDPRVLGAWTNNWTACKPMGTIATPAANVVAPTPVQPTDYTVDPFTSKDLDLSQTRTWNQPQTSDFSKITGIIDLTTDSLLAAGSATNNLTVADFQKIYTRFKRPDGWMVVRVGSTSPISNLNAPGGTFTGKAVWIIEKSVSINGNWPGSTSTSDIQFIWVRTGGAVNNFGTPTNFTGYIRVEPTFNGQMQWGTSTVNGAIHFIGGGSSVTGNGCNNLTVTNSQPVFDAIATAFPQVLGDPAGTGGASAATSSRTVAARQAVLQFIPVGEYR